VNLDQFCLLPNDEELERGLSSSDALSPGKEHLEDQGSFPQFNP
jgi:hypothetical protein